MRTHLDSRGMLLVISAFGGEHAVQSHLQILDAPVVASLLLPLCLDKGIHNIVPSAQE